MGVRRRVFTLLLAAALCAGLLGGCAAEENMVIEAPAREERQETRLTFFGFKYEALNVQAIEDALHGYMDEYPEISISYDGIKSPGYYDVLNKRMDTGNGDDVIMVDHERVLELGGQGKLADLSDLSTLGEFSELARSQMLADGRVDYVPTSISAFGLYCNTQLLEAHGQKAPENLAELEAVCDYFADRGITPIVANNDISLKTVVLAKGLLPLYQGEDTAEQIARYNSGEADLAQALLPGFELVERMLARGWVDGAEALGTAKTKDDLVIFAEGERPFMLTGAWAVSRVRDLAPELQFEVRPYPILEDGSVLVINVDTRISVNADSPHVEEAKRFVEYLTRKDVIWDFANSMSSFSPLEDNRLADERAVQSIGPYLTNGYSVLGSDDNFDFPIWDMTHQCIVGMLVGDGAQAAAAQLRALLADWNETQAGG